MTTETSAPSPAAARTTATRSLWRIGDVASWLAGTVDPDSYVLTLTVSPDPVVVTGGVEDQP